MRTGAWALGLLVMGCGGGTEVAPARETTPVVVVQLSSNPPRAALPSHSLWSGRYVCAQGVTGLSLTLDVMPDGRASAVFDFGPIAENPTVPPGRYLLAGFVSARPDGSTVASLAPDRWIAQPPGYVMVGLTVLIDPAVRTMRGDVDHETCTVAELVRVQ